MKKHDKDYVIKIGEELFKTQGYHNTGTEDILKKSEYPRSSFYYTFKSKEGFAIQVLENYGTNAAQFYQSVLGNQKHGRPLDRLKILADQMAQVSTLKKFKSECLVQKFSVECAAINDDLCKATEIQLDKILDVIRACIWEGQAKQEIRKDMGAMQLAEMYHAQLYGSSILARLKNSSDLIKTNMNMVIDYMKP